MILVTRPIRIGLSPSGNLYSKEILENMVSEWKEKKSPLFGTMGSNPSYSGYIELDCIATEIVDMYVDDEGLVVHQKILDTPQGQNLSELMNVESFKISPRLYVTKSDENIINSLSLISFEIKDCREIAIQIKDK